MKIKEALKLNEYLIKDLLKDTILVDVHSISEQLHSDIIFIPSTVKDPIMLAKATVLAIGSKFRHKGDVNVGDVVMVPMHFGTAHDKLQPNKRIFDGEDVQAIVME